MRRERGGGRVRSFFERNGERFASLFTLMLVWLMETRIKIANTKAGGGIPS